MRGCLWRALKVGLLLFLVLLLVSIGTHRGRVALKSAGFLVEVFPSAPAYPLRWFTDPPTRTEVRYPVGGSETVADVYRPAGDGRRGALLFYIGVGPEHENTHVVRISEALARAGLVVMLPVSEDLSEFRVTPRETEGVVAAFEWLRSQPYVDPDRVGILGISVGGSLAAVGASDPRIASEVRLLDLFGSGYSAADIISALTLRRIQVDGEWREWQPEEVSVDVFRDMLLSTLPEPDRAPLSSLIERPPAKAPQGLSPEGRAVAELLVNRDPDRVGELLAALPPRTREYLAAVSPRTRVADLRAELFLLHDRDDAIIPFTESRRFYEEAVNARGRHLTELRLFRHVEPSAGLSPLALLREGWKLYRHVYSVLLRLS